MGVNLVKKPKASPSKMCAHKRPNGKRCKSRRRPGSTYCPIHARVHDKRVTHGQKTDFAKALGLQGTEAQSYEDFLRDKKPHKLHREMAQARALLVEYRKAYRAALQASFKVGFMEDVQDFVSAYLTEKEGVSAEKAQLIAQKVSQPVSDAFDEHLTILGINSDYIKTITNLIKLIVTIGEKMKKIEEGQTFNVIIKSEYLIEFIREDVFPNCKTLEQRKAIVESLQSRLSRNGIPKALLPEGDPEAIDAEFTEIKEEKGD